MLGVRARMVCVYLYVGALITTTFTASSSSGEQANESRSINTCNPQRINATVEQEVVIKYTLVMEHPDACKDKRIGLNICNSTEEERFVHRANNRYCSTKEGSFQLVVPAGQGVKSNCFNLRGFKLNHTDPIFVNDTAVKVKFDSPPYSVKEIEIYMVADDKGEDGRVTAQKGDVVIPGSYRKKKYILWYCLVMRNWPVYDQCSCPNARERHSTALPYEGQSGKDERSGKKKVIILGVSCLGLVSIVVVTIFICQKNGRRRSRVSYMSFTGASSTVEVDGRVGNVLLLHALDSSLLSSHCKKLANAIIKNCGRKVLDITQNDVTMLHSPETWLLKVLSCQKTIVILVLSPVIIALHRAILHDSEITASVVASVRGKSFHWDVLLPVCLHYLQEHLSMDYKRLFVVRFSHDVMMNDATCNNEDISEFVPSKRFLLPHHQSELLNALGSYQSTPV